MTLTNNITPTISDQTLLDNLSPQNNNNNSEQQTVVQLTAIRRLKNAIIGNRRKKLLFAQMGAIPMYVPNNFSFKKLSNEKKLTKS